MYKQCRLQKANTTQVAWIPSEFAKIGWVLQIKENDTWTDGWKVLSTSEAVEDKAVEHNSRAHKSFGASIPHP